MKPWIPARLPGESLADYLPRVIRAYPEWSRRERELMDTVPGVVDDIMRHVRSGCCAPRSFTAQWVARYIAPILSNPNS